MRKDELQTVWYAQTTPLPRTAPPAAGRVQQALKYSKDKVYQDGPAPVANLCLQ
jgi:hypothetical protein